MADAPLVDEIHFVLYLKDKSSLRLNLIWIEFELVMEKKKKTALNESI